MKTVTKKRKKGWFKKELPFHVMLLPAVIITIIFKYVPFAGISMAFEDYKDLDLKPEKATREEIKQLEKKYGVSEFRDTSSREFLSRQEEKE